MLGANIAFELAVFTYSYIAFRIDIAIQAAIYMQAVSQGEVTDDTCA